MKLKNLTLFLVIVITLSLLSGCKEQYRVDLYLDHITEEDPFNKPAKDGLEFAETAHKVYGVINEAESESNYKEMFESISPESNLVIGLGYKVEKYIIESANNNPNINFVAIDCVFDKDYSNLIGISYKVQESSFLVGYIGGMKTSADKIGFIGGMETDNIYSFDYGFRAGVLYAAKQRGKDIEVNSVYINDFANPNLGYNTASDMYSAGCDVIFHAAGASGLGVINAARDFNKYVIGVDTDQSYLAPQNVLTSALKDIKSTVILTISDYKKDNVYRGGTKYFGLYENVIGIPDINPLVDEKILARTQELREMIINGDIVPPFNKELYDEYAKSLS